jgi:hypothetical protein
VADDQLSYPAKVAAFLTPGADSSLHSGCRETSTVSTPRAISDSLVEFTQAEPASRAACSNRLRYRSHQA